MSNQPAPVPGPRPSESGAAMRSTKKKDVAPRGVFRHSSGVWAVRFTCGAGHIHEETVGRIKSDAVRVHAARRQRVHEESSWCPALERREARKRAQADRERERQRMTFHDYAQDFITWAKVNHRSWQKDDSRLSRVLPALGTKKLDEITTADVERFLDGLMTGERAVSAASRNRYRDLLSGMFKRAIRLGLMTANPVKTIPKLKESGGRIVYLPPATKGRTAYEEDALRDALLPELRPLFTVSVHTGLRWSEQIALCWRDVDMLAGVIGVGHSKNGYSRRVPMNSTARSVMLDLGSNSDPNDANAPVFRAAYRTTARAVERAVRRAQEALRDAGKDASHLDGYTWHGNRHTFTSRLVMARVDLRTVKELGGWRTLSMVERYSHLAPSHLAEAVERLVSGAGVEVTAGAKRTESAAELGLNLDSAASAAAMRSG